MQSNPLKTILLLYVCVSGCSNGSSSSLSSISSFSKSCFATIQISPKFSLGIVSIFFFLYPNLYELRGENEKYGKGSYL